MSEAGTVLLRVSPEVMEELFTRDHAGNRIRVEWGEPDAEGFHEPTFTVDYTDNLVTAALDALAAEVEGLERLTALNDGIIDTDDEGTLLERAAVLAAIEKAQP